MAGTEPMDPRFSRPGKYRAVIEALEDEALYSAAAVARFAVARGLLPANDGETLKNARVRLRIAMGRRSRMHAFPREGDGRIAIPGQPAVAAWYGWRWKGGTPT